MNPHNLFALLMQSLRATHRVPMVIRAGGRLVDVQSIGLETLPGGRLVVTLSPSDALRVVDTPLEAVTPIQRRP